MTPNGDREATAHLRHGLSICWPRITWRVAALRHALGAPIAITWCDGPSTNDVSLEALYMKAPLDHLYTQPLPALDLPLPWQADNSTSGRRIFLVRTFSGAAMADMINRSCNRFQVEPFKVVHLQDGLGAWWHVDNRRRDSSPFDTNQADWLIHDLVRTENLEQYW